MVLAFLDLGALALYGMRRDPAFRCSPAINERIASRVVLCVDAGSCGFVHDVPHFSVDLGVPNYSLRHCGDNLHHCAL